MVLARLRLHLHFADDEGWRIEIEILQYAWELKSYYVNKILDIAESKKVKLAGWQELVMGLENRHCVS